MSDEIDDRPLWEGGILGKYQIKVVPIGDATFRANLMIYNLDEELLFQKEVLANRNLPEGAGQNEYKQWQKVVTDWVLNKS
jgi:hypothetical protein